MSDEYKMHLQQKLQLLEKQREFLNAISKKILNPYLRLVTLRAYTELYANTLSLQDLQKDIEEAVKSLHAIINKLSYRISMIERAIDDINRELKRL